MTGASKFSLTKEGIPPVNQLLKAYWRSTGMSQKEASKKYLDRDGSEWKKTDEYTRAKQWFLEEAEEYGGATNVPKPDGTSTIAPTVSMSRSHVSVGRGRASTSSVMSVDRNTIHEQIRALQEQAAMLDEQEKKPRSTPKKQTMPSTEEENDPFEGYTGPDF